MLTRHSGAMAMSADTDHVGREKRNVDVEESLVNAAHVWRSTTETDSCRNRNVIGRSECVSTLLFLDRQLCFEVWGITHTMTMMSATVM